jgi:hypothetical protein
MSGLLGGAARPAPGSGNVITVMSTPAAPAWWSQLKRGDSVSRLPVGEAGTVVSDGSGRPLSLDAGGSARRLMIHNPLRAAAGGGSPARPTSRAEFAPSAVQADTATAAAKPDRVGAPAPGAKPVLIRRMSARRPGLDGLVAALGGGGSADSVAAASRAGNARHAAAAKPSGPAVTPTYDVGFEYAYIGGHRIARRVQPKAAGGR